MTLVKIIWRVQFFIYCSTIQGDGNLYSFGFFSSFFREDLDHIINFSESHLPFMQNKKIYEFIIFKIISLLHW